MLIAYFGIVLFGANSQKWTPNYQSNFNNNNNYNQHFIFQPNICQNSKFNDSSNNQKSQQNLQKTNNHPKLISQNNNYCYKNHKINNDNYDNNNYNSNNNNNNNHNLQTIDYNKDINTNIKNVCNYCYNPWHYNDKKLTNNNLLNDNTLTDDNHCRQCNFDFQFNPYYNHQTTQITESYDENSTKNENTKTNHFVFDELFEQPPNGTKPTQPS